MFFSLTKCVNNNFQIFLIFILFKEGDSDISSCLKIRLFMKESEFYLFLPILYDLYEDEICLMV